MVGSFLLAWIPYSALSLLEVFNSKGVLDVSISPAIATIPSLFTKTSVVFNPLVYGFMSSHVSHILFSELYIIIKLEENSQKVLRCIRDR